MQLLLQEPGRTDGKRLSHKPTSKALKALVSGVRLEALKRQVLLEQADDVSSFSDQGLGVQHPGSHTWPGETLRRGTSESVSCCCCNRPPKAPQRATTTFTTSRLRGQSPTWSPRAKSSSP